MHVRDMIAYVGNSCTDTYTLGLLVITDDRSDLIYISLSSVDRKVSLLISRCDEVEKYLN